LPTCGLTGHIRSRSGRRFLVRRSFVTFPCGGLVCSCMATRSPMLLHGPRLTRCSMLLHCPMLLRRAMLLRRSVLLRRSLVRRRIRVRLWLRCVCLFRRGLIL
jgi:hypothetical protein